MSRKYFGTDGIRGTANLGVMTVDTALQLGKAAGTIFMRGDHRHRVIVGKDTRLSGYLFENAITAGLLATGMDVFLVGPMPTPAISMLVKAMKADLGVMITASHNPYYDNGLKLFGPDGNKLSDDKELEIERIIDNPALVQLAGPKNIGRAKRIDDAPGRYIEFVKNSFPKKYTLEGLKIIVDTANGAAYHLGSKIFWELGAEVIEIGAKPNGENINLNCGSNDLKQLQEQVLKYNADVGIALDGDADRVQLIDEQGNIINGDVILALIAIQMKNNQELKENTIVATIMSNLAFEQYLSNNGIKVVRSQVGDRYVVNKMNELNLSLGGEQSGHTIIGKYSATGDGLIAALQILALMCEKQQKLSSLSKIFVPLPQIIKNFTIGDDDVLAQKDFNQVLTKAQKEIGINGRIIVRKSGTENLLRVMVEGQDLELLHKIVNQFEAVCNLEAAY